MSTSGKKSKLKSLDAIYSSIDTAMAAIVADIKRNRTAAARPRPQRTGRRTARAA